MLNSLIFQRIFKSRMKRKSLLLNIFIVLFSICSVQAFAKKAPEVAVAEEAENQPEEKVNPFLGKKISVPLPVVKKGGVDDLQFAYFVQGLFISNFQNYSGMNVVERAQVRRVYSQVLANRGSSTYDESAMQEVGRLASNEYYVSIVLTKREIGYSLVCKMVDSVTGSVIGKAYSNPAMSDPGVLASGALDLACRSLILALGIEPVLLENLMHGKNSAEPYQMAVINSNNAWARGYVNELQHGSIIESLMYLNQASQGSYVIYDAQEQVQDILKDLSAGRYDHNSLSEKKLEESWTNLWNEYENFYRKNKFRVVYYSVAQIQSDPGSGKTIYTVTVAQLLNHNVVRIWWQLYSSFTKIRKKTSWNCRIVMPGDRSSDIEKIQYSLVNDNGKSVDACIVDFDSERPSMFIEGNAMKLKFSCSTEDATEGFSLACKYHYYEEPAAAIRYVESDDRMNSVLFDAWDESKFSGLYNYSKTRCGFNINKNGSVKFQQYEFVDHLDTDAAIFVPGATYVFEKPYFEFLTTDNEQEFKKRLPKYSQCYVLKTGI